MNELAVVVWVLTLLLVQALTKKLLGTEHGGGGGRVHIVGAANSLVIEGQPTG